jgi:hypothetical protein
MTITAQKREKEIDLHWLKFLYYMEVKLLLISTRFVSINGSFVISREATKKITQNIEK